MNDSLHRRRLLAGVAGLAATGALVGCTGDDGDSGNGGDDDGGDGDDGSDGDGSGGENGDDGSDDGDDDSGNGGDDDDGGDGEVPETDNLDLQEANVVGVEFEETGGGYRFDVTLHHDDDGEDGYADWWQVERLDGSRLGRRDLLHAHSRQPFTRSETIEVPDDVNCVVVRGHDQIHEYGGVAMLVTLDSGAMWAVDQGPDPQSFEDADCH